MIQFDLPKEKSSIIKVIGIGGGGSNAVNHMHAQNIEGVNFIICNTDAQAIEQSKVPNKVQLGPHLTQGLGAGANPEIGRQATEESLEEIKGILEVNTKMAFITAGMGGGTGTGGAPIISKICKDLGILTVGIVTTPFAYEGKKRMAQAEEGIKNLKQYVDTLLVISNDKLRHQFGNLKMREAFEKADNVLATAAKCITDVINSTGQINVDFADVCTIMRNGGAAFLGSAATEGEDRAQRAIEEALSSPLLNDNDISGAKWILININSAEGEHEFTMDEVDTIQNFLLAKAGEHTDVILGLGYDSTLGNKIGITLIATGFEYKDPFTATIATQPEQIKEEKIVMTLGEPQTPKQVQPAPTPSEDLLAPTLIDELDEIPMPVLIDVETDNAQKEELFIDDEQPVQLELKIKDDKEALRELERAALEAEKRKLEERFSQLHARHVSGAPMQSQIKEEDKNTFPTAAAAGGYLARPSNIYADNKPGVSTPKSAEEPVSKPIVNVDDEEIINMQLVIRNDIPAADEAKEHDAQKQETHLLSSSQSEESFRNDDEEQKRRAAERLQKLRNLSFNINASENNEIENVPAYVRRNMELYNVPSSVENYYSNYTVKKEGDNMAQISTINTFLDGKKPD